MLKYIYAQVVHFNFKDIYTNDFLNYKGINSYLEVKVYFIDDTNITQGFVSSFFPVLILVLLDLTS